MSDMLAELYRRVTVVYMHLSVTKWFYSLCILVKKVNSLPHFWKWDSEEIRFGRLCRWLRELPLAELEALWYSSCRPQSLRTTYGSLLDTSGTQRVSCSLIGNVHPINWKSFDFVSLMLCNPLVKRSNWLLDHNSGVHPGNQTPCLSTFLPRGPGEERSLKRAFRYLSFDLK